MAGINYDIDNKSIVSLKFQEYFYQTIRLNALQLIQLPLLPKKVFHQLAAIVF